MSGNSTLTATQNLPFIPEVVANKAIGVLTSYLNLGKTVSKDSELNPAQVGQTLYIPRRGIVTASQKSQGVNKTLQQPSADKITVTVDQHWYISIAEEDFTNAIQPGSVLPGYVEDGMIVLAEKIESNLLTRVSSFDNIDCASGAHAYEGVVDVRARMIGNKIPQLEQRFGYVSPRFYGRLLKETAVLDPKLENNNQSRIEGIVGRTAGFDLFEGQLTPTAGSPAWDQNFFYLKNALVLASRPLIIPGSELGVQATSVMSEAGIALRMVRAYDKDAMAVVVTMDVLFGSAVNDSRLGFVLESQG